MLAYASQVMIVPGYGLAVAQAQHAVRELADLLEGRGVDVKYAIHPVAGRMPGHMNVLLAEANVPYPQLFDMEDINPEFPRTDVALVIGANDVTNPAARDGPGEPALRHADPRRRRAANVVVLKRSMSPGFAGIDNELFYRPEDGDALRRREGVGREARRGRQGRLTAATEHPRPTGALVVRDGAERVDDAAAEEAVLVAIADATGIGGRAGQRIRRLAQDDGHAVRIHLPAPEPALPSELADDESRCAAHLRGRLGRARKVAVVRRVRARARVADEASGPATRPATGRARDPPAERPA